MTYDEANLFPVCAVYLAVRPVACVGQQRLLELREEVLEHRRAFVHRELSRVKVYGHAAVQPLLQGLLLLQVAVLAEQAGWNGR